jgi:hypothetical protein
VNNNGDLILVSQDADLESVSDRYVQDMIDAFDQNPQVDAVAGKWTLSDEVLSKPTLRAAQRLWYILDRVIQKDAEGDVRDDKGNSLRSIRSPGLVGRNAAFRASIYSAVGGYNPKAKLAEDLEVGWMINNARNYDNKRSIYLNKAVLVSSPRRFLAAFVQNNPLITMYGGFHENSEVRRLDTDGLLNRIPDEFDVSRFEIEVDAIWQAHLRGQYNYLGDRFNSLFDKVMKTYMGVEYEIVEIINSDGKKESHVRIKDASKLIDALKNSP